MLLKNCSAIIGLFVLLQMFLSVNCYSGSAMLKTKRNGKSRQKRLLSLITDPQLNFYFEYNSCYAITQPGTNTGSTSHKVVFPNSYGQNTPESLRQLGDEESQMSNDSSNRTEETISDRNSTNGTSPSNITILPSVEPNKLKKKQTKADKLKHRKIRALLDNYFMSRRRFFKMIESKMDSSGMNGNDCLLKAICETASDSFGQHNGVIGSVVDILFLPSASKDERLPKKYYKAEANGKSRNCNVYAKMCPRSVFDFISTIV